MKIIVNALREWCGTVKTEDDKKRGDLIEDNHGDSEVIFVVSLGTLFIICMCFLGICTGCVDACTCGGCSACVNCANSCCNSCD